MEITPNSKSNQINTHLNLANPRNSKKKVSSRRHLPKVKSRNNRKRYSRKQLEMWKQNRAKNLEGWKKKRKTKRRMVRLSTKHRRSNRIRKCSSCESFHVKKSCCKKDVKIKHIIKEINQKYVEIQSTMEDAWRNLESMEQILKSSKLRVDRLQLNHVCLGCFLTGINSQSEDHPTNCPCSKVKKLHDENPMEPDSIRQDKNINFKEKREMERQRIEKMIQQKKSIFYANIRSETGLIDNEDMKKLPNNPLVLKQSARNESINPETTTVEDHITKDITRLEEARRPWVNSNSSNIMVGGRIAKSLYVEFIEEGGLIRSNTIVEEIHELSDLENVVFNNCVDF